MNGPSPATPLDPQAAAVLRLLDALPEPDYATLDARHYRAMLAQQGVPHSSEPVAGIETQEVPVAGGAIALRIYRPGPGILPAVLFLHGGGWVSCGLDTHDNLCRRLANRSGCAVLAADYRLAPESRFPGPVDDACAALRWMHRHAAQLQIDPARIALSGDSAGGNLAAACALLARDPGQALPRIAHQLLFYPALDAACDSPSFDAYGRGYLLTRSLMQWFWRQYLRTSEDGADPRACPLRAPDLADMPPATVLTAACDPLRDEGERYAQLLRQAGVPTDYRCWEGVFHGFASMIGALDAADAALEYAAQALRRALATRSESTPVFPTKESA